MSRLCLVGVGKDDVMKMMLQIMLYNTASCTVFLTAVFGPPLVVGSLNVTLQNDLLLVIAAVINIAALHA